MGQTINMTLGQLSQLTIAVTDQNGNAVPGNGATTTAVFSNSSVASYQTPLGSPAEIVSQAIGTTEVTYTITGNPSRGYAGTITVGPDTINVNAIDISTATITYGTPS